MLKRDELKGPSCLTNAKDDEPLFVLKSTDEDAPEVVLFWAKKYKERKTKNDRAMTNKEIAKYCDAVHTAGAMEKWREENASV